MSGRPDRLEASIADYLSRDDIQPMPLGWLPETIHTDGALTKAFHHARFGETNVAIALGFQRTDRGEQNAASLIALIRSVWQASELVRIGRGSELPKMGT